MRQTRHHSYWLSGNPQSSAAIANGILNVTGAYRGASYNVVVSASNIYNKTSTDTLSVTENAPSVSLNTYPPAPLTANTCTLSGNSYGNGTYVVTSSGEVSGFAAYNAFLLTQQTTPNKAGTNWRASTSGFNSGGTFSSPATTIGGVTYYGPWITLQTPSSISLKSFTLWCWTYWHGYNSFYLFGSNDGTSWTLISGNTGLTPAVWGSSYSYTVTLGSTASAYNNFKLIITGVNSGGTTGAFHLNGLTLTGYGV
jgi:hypothetical protein